MIYVVICRSAPRRGIPNPPRIAILATRHVARSAGRTLRFGPASGGRSLRIVALVFRGRNSLGSRSTSAFVMPEQRRIAGRRHLGGLHGFGGSVFLAPRSGLCCPYTRAANLAACCGVLGRAPHRAIACRGKSRGGPQPARTHQITQPFIAQIMPVSANIQPEPRFSFVQDNSTQTRDKRTQRSRPARVGSSAYLAPRPELLPGPRLPIDGCTEHRRARPRLVVRVDDAGGECYSSVLLDPLQRWTPVPPNWTQRHRFPIGRPNTLASLLVAPGVSPTSSCYAIETRPESPRFPASGSRS